MVNMKISRHIQDKFQEYIQLFPATGIIGPRQVGKTTLAKHSASDHDFLYLDLERQTHRDKLVDPVFFLSQFKEKCVILDEIQFMPQLFAELRGIIDEDRRPGRFIILGSASPDIIRGSSETLAGRVGYLELTPFTALEVDDLGRLWVRGGYPLSYLAPSAKAGILWRRQFIKTYIQRDLGLLGLNTDVAVMERFWRILASAQGQLLNAENLGRSLGISRTTIKRYIEFLEGAFVLRVLPPWFRNLKKRLVKSPKVYIRDSGLLHSLLGLDNHEALLNHISVGVSWEGFVIEQIINSLDDETSAFFYRTQQGAECDLILEKNGSVVAAIEVKHGARAKVGKGFKIAMEDTKAAAGFLICNTKETFKINEKISVTGLTHFLVHLLPDL